MKSASDVGRGCGLIGRLDWGRRLSYGDGVLTRLAGPCRLWAGGLGFSPGGASFPQAAWVSSQYGSWLLPRSAMQEGVKQKGQ